MVRQRNRQGFSIVELVVVIGIISILLTITTLSFNSWLVKHNMEAQVRTMATDFNEIRMRALTTKKRYRVAFGANSYTFRSYSSEADVNGSAVTGGTKTVTFKLKKPDSTYYGAASDTIEIDQRGAFVAQESNGTYDATAANLTIYLDPGSSSGLNCIKLQAVRINPGNSATIGGICNDR